MVRLGMVLVLVIGCGGDGKSQPGTDAPSGDGNGPKLVDSKMIDATGGTLSVDGAKLTIPANALTAATMITLTKTMDGTPAFLTDASPVYELTPAGTQFAQLVTLDITYPAAPVAGTHMFWSKRGVANPTAATDFEDLVQATITGNTLSAKNNHFTKPVGGKHKDTSCASATPPITCPTRTTCTAPSTCMPIGGDGGP